MDFWTSAAGASFIATVGVAVPAVSAYMVGFGQRRLTREFKNVDMLTSLVRRASGILEDGTPGAGVASVEQVACIHMLGKLGRDNRGLREPVIATLKELEGWSGSGQEKVAETAKTVLAAFSLPDSP
jgi:hypothetical protein